MRLENDAFYCEQILDTDKNIELIQSFCILKDTGKGLEYYLKYMAINDEKTHQASTYLVKDRETQELVGYFSLKASTVAANVRKSFFHIEMDSIPAIELANFAVNDGYKMAHKERAGLGEIIFYYFILPICKKVSEYVGINTICIYALPYSNLIKLYESMHFHRLPKTLESFIHRYHKPTYDKDCIFMSRPLYTEE